MPTDSSPISTRTVLTGSVLAWVWWLAAFDAVVPCGPTVPLVLYLCIGGLGAWFASAKMTWLCSGTRGARVVRAIGSGLAFISLLAIVFSAVKPVNWETRCSLAYCARALGPGLFQSAFPVGAPPCSAWFLCINEYPYSNRETRKAMQRLRVQGCPEP